MGHTLLWIEFLLCALLWVAMLVAVAVHFHNKLLRMLAISFAILLPSSIFGALVSGTGFLRFVADVRNNWFAYFFSLLLLYVIGSILIFHRVRRPTAGPGEQNTDRWPRRKLGIAWAVAATITGATLLEMDREGRSRGVKLREEASALMLANAPPAVADSENATRLYEAAFAQLDPKNSSLYGYDMASNAPQDDPNTLEYLKSQETTIALLRHAAAMPSARFDRDYAHPSIELTLQPNMGNVLRAAQILRLHALYEKSQGRLGSAITDLAAIFHLSGVLANEPMTYSLFMSMGMDAMSDKTLVEILPAITKPQQLAGLQLEESPFDPRLVVGAVKGEEAFGLTAFSDIETGVTNLTDVVNNRTLLGNNVVSQPFFPDRREETEFEFPGVPLLVRIFIVRGDVAAYRQTLEESQNLASRQYYESKPDERKQRDATHRQGLIVGLLTGPQIWLTFDAARARAAHQSARIAVAMTRYRLDHGHLPASPDLLVPNYLREIPVDPFDGSPMRVIHNGAEWTIYSVGPDGKDDRGAPLDYKTRMGDLPFVLKAAESTPATRPAR